VELSPISTGTLVQRATITATNPPLTLCSTQQQMSSGVFTIPLLPPGNYTSIRQFGPERPLFRVCLQ
jgi:hypothetical protein